MAAIPDLAAASSVAATDLLVVNQSGTDRKVTADKFVTVASGVTTVVAQLKITRATIANNGTQALGGIFGLAIVQNASDGGQALLWLSVGSATIISQVAANISTTQGTASKLNVYASGGVFYIENKMGASKVVDFITLSQ